MYKNIEQFIKQNSFEFRPHPTSIALSLSNIIFCGNLSPFISLCHADEAKKAKNSYPWIKKITITS